MGLVWLEAMLPLGIIAGMLCVMGNAQYFIHKAAHGRVPQAHRERRLGRGNGETRQEDDHGDALFTFFSFQLACFGFLAAAAA
ncbi:hypothetical protein BUALT_Bualt08G0088200 [Buddleja alternifolia]|uniref:NADH dehydrogenase [ubiquinone] 1 alpha subcomplex subunit 1 n=1 Tax=Buddleja alternifolia TaxID=168488 RepID=A0AAV6X591_9LAMI|nr:hypothetical protein BUALT_Bualt08G0088200 [Buddleja alternifolia]